MVAIYIVLSVMTMGFEDYGSPYGEFEVKPINENTITVAMWNVTGYHSKPVAITNCAFLLRIDNVTVGPTDKVLGTNGYHHGLAVRMFRGGGISNACVVAEGNVSYVVYFLDSNADGLVSYNDTIVVQATEPFRDGAEYSLTVITEVDSFWSYGMFWGTYSH